MAFEKRDKVVIGLGITITIIFFLVTVYFRSGAF
jgi:hypothetical protein